MDLISVIVPVYKVEEYLDQCVKSIVGQTYKNLEIILVDDGSPDHCPIMCDRWAEKDSRIKVIHKENGGLSDARNAGLKVATGEYVAFIDSDDWVDENLYECLLTESKKCGAQIAACNIVRVYEDGRKETGVIYQQHVFNAEQAMETLSRGDGFCAVAWNKLYQKSLFEGVQYPVGKLHEDEFVTYRLVDRAETLVLCQNICYYYRQRDDSIMAQWSIRRLDALEAYLERCAYLKTKYPDLYLKCKAGALVSCHYFYKQNYQDAEQAEARRRILSYQSDLHIGALELMRLDWRTVLRVIRAKLVFCIAAHGKV